MFDYILHGAIIFFSFIALAQMIGNGYSYGKNKDWSDYFTTTCPYLDNC
jgi:hypothetical protein